MSHDVFVSYSNKDKVIADSVIAAMEQNGIRCWYAPRDIKPGEDWGRAISSAIEKSKVFLVIFSNYSNRSQRVLDEVNLAISNQAVILPFRIENLEPDGAMRLHLSSRHWLDAYEPSWESHIKSLVKNVSINLETTLDEQQIVLPPKISRRVGVSRGTPKKILAGLIIAVFAVIAVWYGSTKWLKPDNTAEIEGITLTEISLPTVTTIPSEITIPTEGVSYPSSGEVASSTHIQRNGILDLASKNNYLELDPLKCFNAQCTLFESLFLNLTNYDKEKGLVIPEAAESWSISADGKLYTFNIRQDIPWVTHNLLGESSQVLDGDGKERFVNARDFEYAIKRMCSTKDDSGLTGQFTPLIKGCQEIYNLVDPNNIPKDLLADVGVRAISDRELLIELTEPSTYFLTMTTLSTIAAIPQWAVEKYGESWTNPGTIVTNGYYVIDNFILGESIHLKFNELLPVDITGGGNIGTINILLDQSDEDAYLFWIEGLIDYMNIPDELVSSHQTTYPDELHSENNLVIFYFGFNDHIEPFNNVHVRRAFAASLDKEAFVKKVYYGNGVPTNHLGMPGMVGASLLDETGLDYDVNFAREELALGGYPNCSGLPQVNFYNDRDIPEDIFRSWEQALGCKPGTINIIYESQTGGYPLGIIRAGWMTDFPDMHNLMGNIIHCEDSLYEWWNRDCGQIDTLIEEARQEISINKRNALYKQIEEALFGPLGEFPIIPVMMHFSNQAVHEWLEIDKKSTSLFAIAYYNWYVDMDRKPTP